MSVFESWVIALLTLLIVVAVLVLLNLRQVLAREIVPEKILKASVSDGEVLVFRFESVLRPEQAAHIRTMTERVLPGTKVLILERGLSLDAIVEAA